MAYPCSPLASPRLLAQMRINTMDYIEKLDKIDAHLAEHPTDYQAVVARLRTISDAYEHQLYERKIARLKRVAEIRERLKGEDNAKER